MRAYTYVYDLFMIVDVVIFLHLPESVLLRGARPTVS